MSQEDFARSTPIVAQAAQPSSIDRCASVLREARGARAALRMVEAATKEDGQEIDSALIGRGQPGVAAIVEAIDRSFSEAMDVKFSTAQVNTVPLIKALGLTSQLEGAMCASMNGLSDPLERDDIGVVASMAAHCLSEFIDAEGARLGYVAAQTTNVVPPGPAR